jgi:hypothetical protein
MAQCGALTGRRLAKTVPLGPFVPLGPLIWEAHCRFAPRCAARRRGACRPVPRLRPGGKSYHLPRARRPPHRAALAGPKNVLFWFATFRFYRNARAFHQVSRPAVQNHVNFSLRWLFQPGPPHAHRGLGEPVRQSAAARARAAQPDTSASYSSNCVKADSFPPHVQPERRSLTPVICQADG